MWLRSELKKMEVEGAHAPVPAAFDANEQEKCGQFDGHFIHIYSDIY